MKKAKLTYTFHNPNTAEDTADFLIKLFVEVNMSKVEGLLCQVNEAREAPAEAV